MTKHVIHRFGPEALQQEGLREIPEVWEDGQRVPPLPGFYERWLFDACLSDGSILLITFYSKPLFDRREALNPGVSISLVQPDGKRIFEAVPLDPEDYSASKERCYVRAGKSWVRGDANWSYELDVQTGSLGAHLNLTGLVPPWRPGTGTFVPDDQSRFFAWLAAVPHGTLEGVLTCNGKMRPVRGTCYHDHRWGSVELNKVFAQWHLGRTHLGEYTLIFLDITTSPEYGKEKIPAFFLAQGSQVLAADSCPFELDEQEFIADEGGRSYPKILQGRWENPAARGCKRIFFTLRDPSPLDSFSLVDFLPTWKRLTGGILTNPYNFTFSAGLELEVDLEGRMIREEGRAVYELALLR
ncbi:MAG: hypothetical protein IH586_17515 [Anaerolineaceae bacterium]|nr:hypothetical protein [Anaerolineaceae bacterium]